MSRNSRRKSGMARRVAGLMSGTSADGVDVAIVDINGNSIRTVAFDTVAHPPAVRKMIFALFDPATSRVDSICHANFALGEVFADALIQVARRHKIPLTSIDLVGSHGQTIYHIPQGVAFGRRRLRSTLQIGEPSVIAERTGITTVGDFRPRDIACGGEGAPLVPFADYILFSDAHRSRALQNIGGIANVTFLAVGGSPADVLAFDTGPGNMIMDCLAAEITAGRQGFDEGGRLAASGKINEAMLAGLMRHPYLKRRPPKSTGREMFGVQFAADLVSQARRAKLDLVDVLATATAFTAWSIADAYERFLPRVDDVILCGGGARNPLLVKLLEQLMPQSRVAVMDEFGINADAKEAVSFAILAYHTMLGNANNVPSATGAARAAVLGKIVPGRERLAAWVE